MTARHIARLCQSCYEAVRPTEYFPMSSTFARCCACGDHALVARVTRDEATEQGLVLFGVGDLVNCPCYVGFDIVECGCGTGRVSRTRRGLNNAHLHSEAHITWVVLRPRA